MRGRLVRLRASYISSSPATFCDKTPVTLIFSSGGEGAGEGEEEERKEKERKKKEEKLYTDLRLRISTSNLTSKLLVRHYAPLGLLKGVAYIYIYIYICIYIYIFYIYTRMYMHFQGTETFVASKASRGYCCIIYLDFLLK